MKTMKFAAFIAAAMSVLALASCNPDPEGPQAEVQTGTVLFSIDNATNIYVAPGEASTIEVKVVRLEGTDATTYTIKPIDVADGIEIPESVSFQQDQREATITISVPAGEAGDKLSFEIMLFGENVNDSANSEEGTLRFEGAVYVYEECITRAFINDYNYENNKYIGYFKQTIWRMADGIYVFKDFLSTGEDLTILRSGSALSFADFTDDTYNDFWYYNDSEGNPSENSGWAPYLYIDEENGEYLPIYPQGDNKRYISELCMYFDPAASWTYYYEGKNYDTIIIALPWLVVEGESENIYKEAEWDAFLNFQFVDQERLDATEFGYPELDPEQLIGAGTTELWGLATTGSADLCIVTPSDGSAYYSIKGWYGGNKDLEIAFDSEGAPYVKNVSTYEYGEYVYTYYYTGCSNYTPYYLYGCEGYDTLTVTDADGTALTSVEANPSSVVVTLYTCLGVTALVYAPDDEDAYEGYIYPDLSEEDDTYSAWKFTYPAVVEEDE